MRVRVDMRTMVCQATRRTLSPLTGRSRGWIGALTSRDISTFAAGLRENGV